MTNIGKALARLREDHRDTQKQADKLAEAISVLEKLTRGQVNSYSGGQGRAKRVLSAAGRRRISLAQKARWAKLRQTKKAALSIAGRGRCKNFPWHGCLSAAFLPVTFSVPSFFAFF